MNETALRDNLVELLGGEQAHPGLRQTLGRVNSAARTARSQPGAHSVWENLEHMRLAQEDILRYTLDESWQSPPFPEGYWPSTNEVTDEAWQAALSSFYKDLDELIALVMDSDVDLTAEIPHGEGRTYLRQVLLTADHNAYHLGQIVQTLKMLGEWLS